MLVKTLNVINKSGLHARPAALFTRTAARFKSEVTVRKDGSDYNGKSIINILSAGICCGTEFELIVTGPDEEEAMNTLAEAVNSGLGE